MLSVTTPVEAEDVEEPVLPPPAAAEFTPLPTKVLPTNYSLHLELDGNKPEFKCVEQINVEVREATDCITLNSSDLRVSRIAYEDGTGRGSSLRYKATFSYNVEDETLLIQFQSPLPVGKGKLIIVFYGPIREDWRGLCVIRNENVETGRGGFCDYTLATHFEPCHARRVFPCWDEPEIKASFQISLEVPTPLCALSNMPATSETETRAGWKLVKFTKSHPMSTYLVAFVVGTFECLDTVFYDGIICSIYTSPGNEEKARFALDIVSKLMPFYTEYFGYPYVLPKLDIVGLSEFPSVTMENWGIIFFKESRLLTEEGVTSSRTEQSITEMIAHVMSQQWFGNLVTMKFWNDLWLKEGMSHFLQHLALDRLFPDSNYWSHFVSHTLSKTLELDGLDSSHPIALPIYHPSKIPHTFDALSFTKSACLLRMLHNYLTFNTFRKGVRLFMNRHKFKSVTACELWEALEETSSLPVKSMMNTWIHQKGFPLIRICLDNREDDSRALSITQEKFCSQPKFEEGEDLAEFDRLRWIIPISFTSARNPKGVCANVLMNGVEGRLIEVNIPDVRRNEWVKLNSGQGFFRVHYPSYMIAEFRSAVMGKTIPPLERLGLLDDLYAMVRCGDVKTAEMLRFLRAYTREDDYHIWLVIGNIVGAINTLLSFTDQLDKFQSYAKRDIFSEIEAKLGWDPKPDEKYLTGLLRVQILSSMVNLGSERTIRTAKIKFKERGTTPIPANLRPVVYRAILKSSSGAEEALEVLLQMYDEANIEEEKARILRALGSVNSDDLRKQVLRFAMSRNVRAEHALGVILGVCGTKAGMEAAWSFFKTHHKVFRERFPVGQFFAHFIKTLTGKFATEEAGTEIESFFKTNNNFSEVEPILPEILENIRLNQTWIERDIPFLRHYLSKV